MKRILLIAVAVCATLAFVFAQSRSQSNPKQAARQQRHEERQQRRAQRLAEYEKYVDSLVLSRNFRFNPPDHAAAAGRHDAQPHESQL